MQDEKTGNDSEMYTLEEVDFEESDPEVDSAMYTFEEVEFDEPVQEVVDGDIDGDGDFENWENNVENNNWSATTEPEARAMQDMKKDLEEAGLQDFNPEENLAQDQGILYILQQQSQQISAQVKSAVS